MPAGNDIVSWQHPRCTEKWQNTRFLEKVCTPKEIQQILTAENPGMLLWAYWAVKEAAYKLSCFLGNRSGFIARRFETCMSKEKISIWPNADVPGAVQVFSPQQASIVGWVQCGGSKYHNFVTVTPRWIHALATPAEKDLQQTIWGVQYNNGEKTDTEAVRLFSLHSLNNIVNNNFTSIEKDKDGIPFLNDNAGANPYISLSHDDGYIAFAFC